LEQKVKTTLTITRYNDDLQMDVDIDVTVSYDVSGSYRPAQRDVSPEEQPELVDVIARDAAGKEVALTADELDRLREQVERENKQRQEDF
jgi:hypothetical protein